ncbi:MAG: PolC-type DNA polymerase III [Acholeplasmatales bacterium]|nr:PolC-type DNA polymerase III [Acholeplasmatales bacterium]
MTLLEIINNSNILDSDNEIRIDEAIFKKISKKLFINLVLANAVPFNQYNALKNKVTDVFSDLSISLELSIGYENEELTDIELKEYLDEILKVLVASSARFKALNIEDCAIEDNKIIFKVAYDSLGMDDLCKPIIDSFEKYGLNVVVSIEQDQDKSVKAQIDALDDEINKQLDIQKQEAMAAAKFNKEIKESKKSYRMEAPSYKTLIKDIPSSQMALSEYENKNGLPNFLIEAYVFDIEIKSFAKTSSLLATIKVTDETDSIVIKKWLRGDKEKQLFNDEIKKNKELRIVGKAEYDTYARDVVITANDITIIGEHKEEDIKDDAAVKRVELHAHTKMSTLDGLTDAGDYIKQVLKWGWKSMAFTDHSGVYAIPDIAHSLPKDSDFKPIYGVELAYVNDDNYFITFDKRDINLRNATYVVFDIETTGFSQTYDDIIEIAAVKLYQGGIISTYETFVNPKRHISEKITNLTSITDEMVADAPTIEEVIPKFMEYCKDSILVAHNAKFDVGFIYAQIKKLGLNYEVLPALDTLNLFRANYYTEVKKFNLKVMSKHFKVKQEQHHRAIDDTRVTAICFLTMLNDLYGKGITNYADINSCINKEEHWKHVIPPHINILAKNQIGYKNMFKLVSDALTNHIYGEAKALKSIIDANKEGLLLGSGCANGEVFENALNRSEEDCLESMKYYDFIEVQPPSAYQQYYSSLPNGKADIEDTISRIIKMAKSLNKIVVATSDCHYLRPRLKKYRDILIQSPQIGGGTHRLANADVSPNMHLRTTNEMLEEFEFLGKDLAYEIVVENTNLIADSIDYVKAFSKDMYAPRDDEFKDGILGVESIVTEVRRIVAENQEKLYGTNPHEIVKARINRELESIISNGYASVYYMSHLMVVKSLNDGYLVGSRGSVGSSLVATMMDITEINPLAPHYRCKKCKFHAFKMNEDEKNKYGIRDIEQAFQDDLQSVDSGYDLPDAICPVCGEKLAKDGHDIPFETFLGFNGDKVPDIDLNFSGEYQNKAHEYIREVFGPENAFRGGTVGTIAEKNAFGYVKGYCERTGVVLRDCEMQRIAQYLVGVKRSTGQHPGGIIVVPHYVDIYDVTPIQYPADNFENAWRTTHFDYHSFEDNLLKLDVLGHDDPTIIKFLMDYVNEHQEEFPFDNPKDIPIDDKNIYRLFNSTDVIGLKSEDIDSPVSSFAVPEFGTNFVRQMLVETLPKTFAQLVKISGLSHGTDVWATNAQDLVGGETEFGVIDFADVIGCRDDIMVFLMYQGLEPLMAFQIMEFVRKGRVAKDPAKWTQYRQAMIEKKVPEWYIWSCERIKYMFPKAHATAYVLMALRIAWFKVYSPALFYSAWFSKRAKAYNVQAFLGGPIAIRAKIDELKNKVGATAKDEDLITALQVALEMTLRGIKFLPVDITKSTANIFTVENGNLRMPFTAVDGLGEAVALDIVEKRNEKEFTSKKDVSRRTRLNQTLFEEFDLMHAFGNLPDEELEETEGLFAFLN